MNKEERNVGTKRKSPKKGLLAFAINITYSLINGEASRYLSLVSALLRHTICLVFARCCQRNKISVSY